VKKEGSKKSKKSPHYILKSGIELFINQRKKSFIFSNLRNEKRKSTFNFRNKYGKIDTSDNDDNQDYFSMKNSPRKGNSPLKKNLTHPEFGIDLSGIAGKIHHETQEMGMRSNVDLRSNPLLKKNGFVRKKKIKKDKNFRYSQKFNRGELSIEQSLNNKKFGSRLSELKKNFIMKKELMKAKNKKREELSKKIPKKFVPRLLIENSIKKKTFFPKSERHMASASKKRIKLSSDKRNSKKRSMRILRSKKKEIFENSLLFRKSSFRLLPLPK